MKDEDRVARRHASQTRGDGCAAAVKASEGKKSCDDRSYPEQESTSDPGNRKADAEFDTTCS
ncbi:MAG: hypothetical protein KY448_07040 [Cyanobacteria bacterium 0813]|nr:hypothetical protein [Cyanobacteria bacterium 0813]